MVSLYVSNLYANTEEMSTRISLDFWEIQRRVAEAYRLH